jgi:hypothetical protein
MRKGKYVSKIKKNCDHLGREGQLRYSFVSTLYHLKGNLFKINLKTANDKKKKILQ